MLDKKRPTQLTNYVMLAISIKRHSPSGNIVISFVYAQSNLLKHDHQQETGDTLRIPLPFPCWSLFSEVILGIDRETKSEAAAGSLAFWRLLYI